MELIKPSQNVYRDLLMAMSRPGTVRKLMPEISLIWGSGLMAATATLIDQEVSFHVVEDESLARSISHTTHGRVLPAEQADFILMPAGTSKGLIKRVRRGRAEYPDQGATLIYQVELLKEGRSDSYLQLTGPGIKETAQLTIEGVDLDDLLQLSAVNSQYPLGVDVLLTDRHNQVAAIPRSVAVAAGTSRPTTAISRLEER